MQRLLSIILNNYKKRLADFVTRHKHQPAAIITANGALMLLVTKVLHAMKLVWGQDIGLASFDEMNWSSIAGCGITTLQQPTHQIGYSAFQNILTRLKHSENPAQETRFEGRLIVRPSSQILYGEKIIIENMSLLIFSFFIMEPIPFML